MPSAQAQTEAFTREVSLRHPIEAVWAAVTRKELVDKYYFVPLGADISQAGVEIFFGPPNNKAIVGTVVAYEPPRLLRHTFRFVGDDKSPDTTVTYTLTSEPGGTRLHLEHRGYPVDSQGYADISGGWPVLLDGLKAVLDGQRK